MNSHNYSGSTSATMDRQSLVELKLDLDNIPTS